MEQKKFTVTAAGIIHNPGLGKILIGRKEHHSSDFSSAWEFPASSPLHAKNLEDSLHDEIKKNINLSVEVQHPVFSRTRMESEQRITVYYYCETYQTNAKASGNYAEVQWIKPLEYKSYLRIPAHPALAHLMRELEKKRPY